MKALKRIEKGMAAGLLALMIVASGCEKKTAETPVTSTTTASGDAVKSTPVAAPATASGSPAEVGGKAPRPLSPLAATAVTIPETTEGDDAGLIGYLRLREPGKTVDRIGPWAEVFDAGSSEMVRQSLVGMGIDVTKLRAGGNLTFLAFKPDMAGEPPMAAIIPAPAESDTAKSLVAMKPGASVTPAGSDMLLAQDSVSLKKAKPVVEKLQAINDQPLGTDIQTYFNVSSLMELYGPMLRSYASMMQMMMAGATANAGQSGMSAQQTQAAQQAFSRGIQQAFEMLEQIKSFTWNANFDPNALEISGIVNPKPGTKMATGFSGAPVQSSDIAQFLSPDAQFKMQVALADLKTMTDIYKPMLSQLLPPEAKEQTQKLEAMIDRIGALGAVDMAFGMSVSATGKPGMQFDGIARGTNATQMIQILRDNTAELKALMTGPTAGTPGSEMNVEIKQDVRKVQGQPVDQIVMTMKFPADMAADQRALAEKMWGGETMITELMPLGDMMLYSTGKPVDELATRVASGNGPTKLAAREAFEPGATFFADVDVAGWITSFEQMTTDATAGGMAPKAINAPPLTVAAYHQGGKAYYRAKVPKDLVTTLKKAAEERQGGGMGSQGMGMPPEGMVIQQSEPAATPTPSM